MFGIFIMFIVHYSVYNHNLLLQIKAVFKLFHVSSCPLSSWLKWFPPKVTGILYLVFTIPVLRPELILLING